MGKSIKNYSDFLRDDLFIYWRIRPTKELNRFWEEFIFENEELHEAFNQAIDAFEAIRNERGTFDINEDEDARFKKLQTKIINQKKRSKSLRIFTSSAAAVLLLIVVSTLLVHYNKPENTEAVVSSIGEIMSNNNVQLITGSNVLELDDNSTLNLSEKKQRAVIRNPFTRKEINLTDNQSNKLVVPYGKRSTLILADGSKVHLNSGTKMEFPSTFSGKQREIHVEGEIFIEVTKQSNVPFLIHTPHSRITVHGTSFNVSSYAEDESESVVLVNGSVEVKSENHAILLQPNEMARIEDGQIQKKQVDVSDYTSWVDGYMQLSKTPLNEVLKKIGRYYNVQFQYDAGLDLHNQTCSGKLFLSDDFNDVLDAFSKMTYLLCDEQSDEIVFIH